MPDIRLSTLPNGMRVITDRVDSVDSVAVGVWIGAGTRQEEMIHNGAAHMVEHMLFKGTKTRSALEIVKLAENVGGSMNAYTSREITSYHIHLMREDTPLALDLLADMVQNSTLPQDEVERERHVILQEIGMTNDTPDDLIFDNYYETAYQHQMLGAPILGKSDIISSMSREALLGYIHGNYTAENTVISLSGNIDHDDVIARAEKLFDHMPQSSAKKTSGANYTAGESRTEKELEQAHIVLGFEGMSRTDDLFYAAQALSNILGGGMSSRLFQEVREKRGLAYSVFSFHSGYQGAGQFGVYTGTSPAQVGELVPVLCEEMLKIADTITDEEIHKAKTQLKSGMVMGRESMMYRADQHAKYLLHRGTMFSQKEIMKKVDAVDAKALKNAAKNIFGSKPTLCALGPLANLESYEKVKERLAA